MNRFLKHIAVLLLVLFIRAMVPDALLLRVHSHAHTFHTEQSDSHKAEVGKKHTHCPVEDLFGAPFQAAVNAVSFEPLAHSYTYTVHYTGNWYGASVHNTSLRGPPAA